jgi:hypothetical protein
MTREYPIDLEESLWSLHEGVFPPDPLFYMQRAFDGDITSVIIRTAAKAQKRFGSVKVTRARAEVAFYFVWDDPVDLVCAIFDYLDPAPNREELSYAIDRIAIWCMEATWQISRRLEAETFDELMEKIDQVESDLMELERRQGGAFTKFLDQLVATIKDNRAKM